MLMARRIGGDRLMFRVQAPSSALILALSIAILFPMPVHAAAPATPNSGVSFNAAHPGAISGSVSAGGGFSCGITTSGSIACWGDYANGILNTPSGTFTAVSAGSRHACAVD